MTTPLYVRDLTGDAHLPAQPREGDAGYDLHATARYVLAPHERALFDTGIAVAIPEGHVGYIKPRSGLAAKQGLDVLGGVIDSGYRGEVKVILYNTDPYQDIAVSPGDRIAQLVIHPIITPAVMEVFAFPAETARGTNGFGSTGVGVAL